MANFSGNIADSVLHDTTVGTTSDIVTVDNEVNNMNSQVPVLHAIDPSHVALSSQAWNVSATPPSVVGQPLTATHILDNQNGSLENGPETGNGAVLVNNRYQPIKVFIDGIAVGRKIDLSMHDSFESLVQTLDSMFRDWGLDTEGMGSYYLLSGKFEYVLTFQDHEGDWVFARNYIWQEFQRLVKKILIMKNPESLRNGYRERAVEAVDSEQSDMTDNI